MQLLDAEVAAGDPDAFDAGSMGCCDVERSIADGETTLRVDWRAEDERCPLERLPGQLRAVVRVRSVAPEAEEAVEPSPVQLDVRRCLRSRSPAQADSRPQAAAAEARRRAEAHRSRRRQLRKGGSVAVRAGLQAPCALARGRPRLRTCVEPPAVGHPRVRVLPDVGRSPYSSSNANRHDAAPAPPVSISVPSMSNSRTT